MRHLGEVGEDRLAGNILSEDQGETPRMIFVDRGTEKLAQNDGLCLPVRQLDADHIAPWHDGDAYRNRAHRARDVVGEPDDARGLDPGCGFQFVQRHDRPRANLHDLTAHTEILEHGFEQAGIFFERVLVDGLGFHRLRLCQEIKGGQDWTLVRFEIERRLSLLIGALSGGERLRPGDYEADEPAALAFSLRSTWHAAIEPRLAAVGQYRHDGPRARIDVARSGGRCSRADAACLPPMAEQSIN